MVRQRKTISTQQVNSAQTVVDYLDQDDQEEVIRDLLREHDKQQRHVRHVFQIISYLASVVSVTLVVMQSRKQLIAWIHAIAAAGLYHVQARHLLLELPIATNSTAIPPTEATTTNCNDNKRLIFMSAALIVLNLILGIMGIAMAAPDAFPVHSLVLFLTLLMTIAAIGIRLDDAATRRDMDNVRAAKYRYKTL